MSSFRPYHHYPKNSPFLAKHGNVPVTRRTIEDIAYHVQDRSLAETHDNFVIQNNANKHLMLGWKSEYYAGADGNTGFRGLIHGPRFRWTD